MFVTCVVLVCQVQTAYKCVCDMCGVGVSGADSLQVCVCAAGLHQPVSAAAYEDRCTLCPSAS